MAASKSHLLARAVQRRQAILINRAKTDGMPQIIKQGIWEKARGAFLGQRPQTHKERVEAQTLAAGLE